MSSRRKQSKPRFLKADVDCGTIESVQNETSLTRDGDVLSSHSSLSGEEATHEGSASEAEEQKSPTASLDNRGDDDKSVESADPGDCQSVVCTTAVEQQEEEKSEFPFSIGITEEFPYGCVYCNKAFTKFNHVRDHEAIHNSEMPYQCEYCKRSFRHKRSRDRHMKLHTGDKSYKCSLCDAAFSRSDHLKNHLRSHSNRKWLPSSQKPTDQEKHVAKEKDVSNSPQITSTSPVPTQCQLCKENFTDYYQLDEHLRGHAQTLETPTSASANHEASSQTNNNNALSGCKSLEYHCTQCAKQSLKQVFTSLAELEQHVTRTHSGKGLSLLSCPHCKAAFPTVPTLNEHIEQEHEAKGSGSSTSLSKSGGGPLNSELLHLQLVKKFKLAQNSSSDRMSQSPKRMDAVVCNLCSRSFPSITHLMTHMMSFHSSPAWSSPTEKTNDAKESSAPLDLSAHSPVDKQSHLCPLCGDNFDSKVQLMEHNQLNHLEIMEAKCNGCSESISTPQQHLEHMEKHYLSTRRHYICRCCKASFSLVDELQAHLVLEHSRRLYKCLLCTEIFHSEVDLKIHLTVEHSNESKIFRCACCGRDFDDIPSWRSHLLHAHIDLILPSNAVSSHSSKKDRLLKCPYCVQTFHSESDLNLHILSHQKSFQCSLCPEKFAVEYLRDKHMQTVHLQYREDNSARSPKHPASSSSPRSPFFCAICDQIFHSEDVFEEHKRKSHATPKTWLLKSDKTSTCNPVNQTKMFGTTCGTCGKSFKTYSELDKHSRVHFGPVSLTCVICDELCSSISEMAKHKLQHCKVPAIKPCILCPKEVLSAQEYVEHSSQHIEPDSTVICCVCKHKISSQIELEIHAEFHFPKKSPLKCASCGKPCPYGIKLCSDFSQGSQFLLCQDCLISRREPKTVSIPVNNRNPSNSADAISPVPSSRCSTSSSPRNNGSSPSGAAVANGTTNKQANKELLVATPPQQTSTTNFCVYKCSSCTVKFESLEELESHSCMLKQCCSCHRKFRISEMKFKLDSYVCKACDTIPQSDLWKCDKCKLTFTREEKYQKHNCLALGDGKECKMCQGRFNHSQLLLRGNGLVCKKCIQNIVTCSICKETHASGDKHLCQFKCELCHDVSKRSFETGLEKKWCSACLERRQLPLHIDLGKGSEKIYQCIKCQKTCNSEDEIKLHVLTQHVNETAHKCHLCSQLFSTPAKLQTHLIDHNFAFSSKMSCPVCQWQTANSSDLINHCVSEHNVFKKKFVCFVCSQSFFFETELFNHTYAHHNGLVKGDHPTTERPVDSLTASTKRPTDDGYEEPPTKLIKSEALSDVESDDLFCGRCDAEFASLDLYDEHMKNDHKGSMVNCCKCSRLFSCNEDLIDHQSTCRYSNDSEARE